MPMPTNVSTGTRPEALKAPAASYGGPLAVLTTLFFMWGSLTSLNDVLIPYAQHVFNLSLAKSMLIQTAFFLAYFVFSIPSSKIIDWLGYKKAIVVGLLTMVIACLGFYPAAKIPSFPFFLAALIVLATGITVLQVAANPYVAVLGKPQTASSRLVLTQAFNSLGTAVFPFVGARVILGTTTTAIAQSTSQQANAIIRLYVYFFAVALFLLAIGFAMSKLPKIGGFASSIVDPATRYHAALGEAARYISAYWLGAMIGRFIGSAILQKVKAGKLLALCAIMAALLVSVSVLTNGHVAVWSILAVGLFNSIMFPCIFTLGIAELGPLTGDGSGILNMAIVGGAVIPLVVGKIGDLINRAYYPAMTQGETSWGQGIHYALVVAVICYLYILFFAMSGSKPNSERYATGVAASE